MTAIELTIYKYNANENLLLFVKTEALLIRSGETLSIAAINSVSMFAKNLVRKVLIIGRIIFRNTSENL